MEPVYVIFWVIIAMLFGYGAVMVMQRLKEILDTLREILRELKTHD